ncbi:MAG TPA: hypothetical protein VK764_10525 [Terracidiphilus sp.]|jgi:hypothetical protein|nr:hypothetical protein [Terracidiphilus sp.]
MSNEQLVGKQAPRQEDETSRGPNLVLIYSLLLVALVAAMGIAALIVLPFYRHSH